MTTHTFTSLSASTAYTYSVKAINGNTTANTSPALNGTGSVTTLGLETAPAQPGTISTVGAPTATAFTVQWTASANFGTDAAGTTITAGNYKICRSDGVTATADKACQTIPSATTPLQATFSGLNAGITYQLSLTATNANTTANTSTPRTLGVLTANGTPDNVPPQPGPITVTGTTDTSVSITWPAVANFGTNGTGVAYTAGNYVVCRDDGAGGAVNQDCQTVASTAARQVTFSGLTTGLTYKVEVKATNANATNNTSTASTRNIQALAGGVGAPVDVPTLGEWGVIILSLLLAGSAVLVGRRRRF